MTASIVRNMVLSAALALSLACSKRLTRCDSPNDCSVGSSCDQGYCKTLCIDSYDCASGEECIRGLCDPCSTTLCAEEADGRQGGDIAQGDGDIPADGSARGDGSTPGDQAPDEDCPESSACDDLNPCTHDDICVSGVCRGTPYSCDDSEPCTQDICDGLGGCAHPNLGPTVSCDDGAFCNGTDTCDGNGTCVHSGDPCAALVGNDNSDCSESCDETSDTCSANDPQGSNCNDGESCTHSDACNASGVCVGVGYSCSSGCTLMVCNGSGGCTDSGQANPNRVCAPTDTGTEPCFRANPTGTCCGCSCHGIRNTGCNADCSAMVQTSACFCGNNCTSQCGSAPCEWCDGDGNLWDCCAGQC